MVVGVVVEIVVIVVVVVVASLYFWESSFRVLTQFYKTFGLNLVYGILMQSFLICNYVCLQPLLAVCLARCIATPTHTVYAFISGRESV